MPANFVVRPAIGAILRARSVLGAFQSSIGLRYNRNCCNPLGGNAGLAALGKTTGNNIFSAAQERAYPISTCLPHSEHRIRFARMS